MTGLLRKLWELDQPSTEGFIGSIWSGLHVLSLSPTPDRALDAFKIHCVPFIQAQFDDGEFQTSNQETTSFENSDSSTVEETAAKLLRDQRREIYNQCALVLDKLQANALEPQQIRRLHETVGERAARGARRQYPREVIRRPQAEASGLTDSERSRVINYRGDGAKSA